jgi:hypothetical protein
MKNDNFNLSKEQKQVALQRLTALWAFTESGLGGIMHALQIPFTGLLVGGMAVIMICLIAKIGEHDYKQILKSALIVLIVKAMVSPHTPFPAYIAVSFQALLGYGLFRLINVNFFSIILLSTIAMLESAIQKLLILTLFFGKSLWKAMDNMIEYVASQFGFAAINGSYWIVGIYLLLYLTGGFFIAWLALRTITNFYNSTTVPDFDAVSVMEHDLIKAKINSGKNNFKKIWIMVFLMLLLSAILFFFATDTKLGWLAVAKTITWTLSAILIWYMLIGPLFTKAIQKFLHKKESRYTDEVIKTLSFLPVLKKLTAFVWKQSKLRNGKKRWIYFFSALIHATLTYTEPATTEKTFNKSA